MARRKVEFYCSNCCKYFDVKLNMSLNGNHRVHCPNCGHIHFRLIENGEITTSRFNEVEDKIIVDDLRPMKASCRDFQKEVYEDNVQTGEGFMKRLWDDKHSFKVT